MEADVEENERKGGGCEIERAETKAKGGVERTIVPLFRVAGTRCHAKGFGLRRGFRSRRGLDREGVWITMGVDHDGGGSRWGLAP